MASAGTSRWRERAAGQPVMAFDGYNGGDPVIDLEAFARLTERGEVRFVILSNTRKQRDFDRWVRTHGVAVDPSRWRSLPPEPRRSVTLYDLKPT